MTTQKTLINSEALLNALAQQTKPLPKSLQHSLQKVGQALQTDQPKAAYELRELIKQEPLLETAYQNALEQWDEQYAPQQHAPQQHAKGFNAAFQNSSVLESFFLHDVAPSPDWVTAARKITRQPTTQPTTIYFWDKTDRIVVMTIGGASIGGAIAQIPGALVGATVAALYGWYIGFAKTKSKQAH